MNTQLAIGHSGKSAIVWMNVSDLWPAFLWREDGSEPQHNERHQPMHLTPKNEATGPPSYNFQGRFEERPHLRGYL